MAKRSPIVSVVIPCYRAEDLLEETLASVRVQTLDEIEVLCVDDGSPDGTRTVIEATARRDDRVRLLRHPNGENRGVSRSRELGVQRAGGEFVAFLDSDDLFQPEKLERQVAALRSTDALMCHTAVDVVGEWPPERRAKLADFYRKPATYPNSTYAFLDREDALISLPIVLSSTMVRRQALGSIPFAIPQLFQTEDWLLWLLLSEQGRFHYLDEPLTSYRVHEASYNARVKDHPLKGPYSRLELCLSALALAATEELRSRLREETTDALGKLLATFGARDRRSATLDGLEESGWKARALRAEKEVAKLERSFLVRLTRRLRGRE